MWNYRIVKTHWKIKKLKGVCYEIREVSYKKDGSIHAWTGSPQYLAGDTSEDLMGDLILIKQAFKRPILEEVGEKLVEIINPKLK